MQQDTRRLREGMVSACVARFTPPLELDAASPLAHDGQQQHSDSLPALLQSCLLALLLEQQGGSSGQASS